MRIRFIRTARGRSALLAALVGLAVTGCADAGGLHDAGQSQAVAAHPSPQPLWPGTVGTPAAASQAPNSMSPPVAVPGLSVPGDDLRTVDARTVLERDPSLPVIERTALTGCPGCLVEPAQYRDLTGDGRVELITALVSPLHFAYLNVYADQGGRVLPILDVPVVIGFSAETIGTELVVHEPYGTLGESSSTYRWSAPRLVLVDRVITPTVAGADPCLPGPGPIHCLPVPGSVPAAGSSAGPPLPDGGRSTASPTAARPS
ncbi:hypothetical protein [Kitasatospora sp. NBC_01266]|uniref:hypothetical protein n=1 Tax=Kitasatospora sp. NBC_01266 TaxID=2903572 RepID=UPI002E327862|nr:hypothetical protein [Kitasatospora sp. NBC_01266]